MTATVWVNGRFVAPEGARRERSQQEATMKERRVLNTFRALDTSDGAGVRLKRALGEAKNASMERTHTPVRFQVALSS